MCNVYRPYGLICNARYVINLELLATEINLTHFMDMEPL